MKILLKQIFEIIMLFSKLQNKKVIGTFFLLCVAILYGLEPIVAKLILERNDPMQVQFMRYSIAAILLLPLLFTKPIKRLTKKQIFHILLLGFLGMGIASPLFYLGLKLTTGLNATLIEKSYPFLVFILAFFCLKERITIRKVFGTSLVILGVVLILSSSFLTEGTSITLGNLIVLGAMMAWAVWIILAKSFVKDIDPEILTVSGFIVGLFAMSVYLKGAIIPIFTLQMLILGIISALAWLLYFKGLKYITAMKATAIESTAPFFTAIFTMSILVILPSLYEFIAIFLVIPGLLLLIKEE